ncbi:hypothetical protein CMO96_01410 [Candidatus Woesebacteria bacterium]|nr:hypothetical protein [Candidatus Woesebacteria bacterium]
MLKKDKGNMCWCGHGGYGGGVFLLLLGVFWLMGNLGVLPGDTSFWPYVFIIFGIYSIARRSMR